MPDNFERFIHQHRDEFEIPGPSTKVWEAMERELTSNRKGRVVQLVQKNWFKVAIIAALLINAGGLYYLSQRRHHQQGLSVIAPDIQEAGVYYTSRINEKLQLINAYSTSELGLDSAARKELALRNDTYKSLEKELKSNPGNERIRAAMIRYYQLKLDLLDKILEELQDKHVTPGHTKKQYEAEI
ncbi:hypothetical protein ACDQ55_10120 [Chitinophaga sp. 30R24]|uniref:hypothetical protein n=1 Tax=Chitinophaga sp. 30R24 TaxID=3248838 RepID=UPI003B8FC43E